MSYQTMGDEVSVDACIVQATVALDASGILALESRETENMLKVAETWVKLADFMAALERSMAEESGNEEKKEKRPFGFTPSEPETVTLGGDFEIADDDDEQLEIEFEDEEDV